MAGQFMNDREKDEEIVVTYFIKQYRNVHRMTTVKHKKTDNNWPPGSPNRGPGVTMFIKTVPMVLGSHNICNKKKKKSLKKLNTTECKKKNWRINWMNL